MEEKKKQEKVEMAQGASTFKIEIPEPVEAKIRHLCSRVHDVEWSGTLFYKVEGSMEDGTFKVICLDIFVMDIGSAGFTDYDDSPEIIAYRVANRGLLLQPDVYEGLIHSHNNMATFFSGTDLNTLKQEGSDVTHFVSLIVNNAGTYTARITRKLVRKVKAEAHIVYTEDSFYNSFENTVVPLSQGKVTTKDTSDEKETTVIEWFPLEIVKATVEEKFKDVDARLSAIRSKKKPVLTSYNGGGYRPAVIVPTRQEIHEPANVRSGVAFSHEEKTPEKNLVKQEKEPVQGNLFPEMEEGKEQLPYPLALTESFDENLIKSLCTQLLTGCILVDGNNNIDPEEWVKKMDGLYEKRFGDLKVQENYEALESWLEQFVELLVWTRDEALEDRVFNLHGTDYDESGIVEVCAYDMVRFLEDLPDSLVKEMMIEELYTYMSNVKEYI